MVEKTKSSSGVTSSPCSFSVSIIALTANEPTVLPTSNGFVVTILIVAPIPPVGNAALADL